MIAGGNDHFTFYIHEMPYNDGSYFTYYIDRMYYKYRKFKGIKAKKTRTVGLYLCVGFLSIYALCNFCSIIGGYKRNDEINKKNHYKLAEIGKSYKEGLNIEEVELYKLYDDRYVTNMPYQEGFEYIEFWMKNYYELPQEIRFCWREMKEKWISMQKQPSILFYTLIYCKI